MMDFSYSSHAHSAGEIGGTLHLSPSHSHHVDTLSTIRRKLRRSLSRSPSRPQNCNRSFSASSVSPISPTQLGLTSPLGRGMFTPTSSQEIRQGNAEDTPTTGMKRSRMPIRRTPSRLSERLQNSARNALRRGLSETTGNGNVSPLSSQSSTEGQENYGQAERIVITGPLSFKNPGTSKKQREVQNLRGPFPKSSPLKRSDGFMNLDTVTLGSPSAKRRSLHGGSLAAFLDPDRSSTDESNEDGNETDEEPSMDFRASLAPRMTLRRSNLSQRASDRQVASRTRRSFEMDGPATRSGIKGKPRMSLDSATPFNQGQKDPARLLIKDVQRPQFSRLFAHPLSKALNPDSPTFPGTEAATRDTSIFQSPARPHISFSKSLPIGALRPQLKGQAAQALHDDAPFATPNLYKIARPDPAAFMSTGLISKRHRNPEDLPPPPGVPRDMPDTPCKRFPGGFAMPSSPNSVKSIAKPRFAQPEFGTPSKPFNLTGKAGTGSLGSLANIFGSSIRRRGDADRRISFGSIDGDDFSQTPSIQAESQSSNDELPPTPTKKASETPSIKQNSLRSALLGRRPTLSASTFVPPSSAEQQLTLQVPSLFAMPAISSAFFDPSTPANNAFPDPTFPDPSVLSISPQVTNDSPLFNGKISTASAFPETPTSHRESTNTFASSFTQSVTPNHQAPPKEVDSSLLARFRKVEWYSGGEFSEVYKVTQTVEMAFQPNYFSPAPSSRPGETPALDKVWIVKKLKAPYTSLKVREKRLQEVEIMKALGRHDHVVHLSDSWEANNRLYIQTEFCEEGNLHLFLAKAGHNGRLDDFRIWKILIELCQGLKHIHDAGFIHLDLKPANVFIDFDGVLKIGDFGMASRWPAPPNVEGEGDRRYMGPDLLQGRFDKPADIFAMGMIMFEIAGNCIPPDNGVSWQKLRSGDWEGLPSLTSGSSNSNNFFTERQESMPFLEESLTRNSLYGPQDDLELFDPDAGPSPWSSVITPAIRKTPPEDEVQPPNFMIDAEDGAALDHVVRWMMRPDPADRPTVDQLFQMGGVIWVNARRRSGATVYEGQWGPSNQYLNHMPPAVNPEDEEMLDVP